MAVDDASMAWVNARGSLVGKTSSLSMMISAGSGGGMVRPGFEKLLSAICEERVGAVVSLEVSRLARNGRDWHTLLEFCGLVGTLIVDEEAIYDPRSPNDRLLLGMKGTMSEMELSVFRQRSLEAKRQKARRGELHLTVAVGYVKTDDSRVEKDPDRRIQDGILLVFRKFAELQSIRQVLLWFRQENILVPAIMQGRGKRPVEWKGTGLSHAAPHADESGMRWLLRLWSAGNTGDNQGRPQADHARYTPAQLEGLGGF
ncbi:DNA invertase Pin-like site-specific DNA recombinase [Nitrobacter winogradskyi]|uniref:DNA invertase Pin-like site-specific DNA recombinase n=3 Tax=Nitrobacter winogradskyi TaxID=913 RepID=A0ACC6APD8_NITWI|nr:recombinase family protein [Nitrobacter winogradskyi]MCP2000750.1 DNA invertase Pin-like site-specific DNA recombinase [Nitrobacter winogradskyi]